MDKNPGAVMRVATYIVGILLIGLVLWQIATAFHQKAIDRMSRPDTDVASSAVATVYLLPPPDDMVDVVYYVNTKSDKYHTRKCPITQTVADGYIRPADIDSQTQYRKCPYCLDGHSVGSSQQQSDDAEYQVAKTTLLMRGDPQNLEIVTDMTKQQEDAAQRGKNK